MSDARPERRLAAILATDVAGYSRLMGSNEETTLARLNLLHQGVIYPAIAEYRGRVIKTMGDGLLAEFASAVDAVRCAVVVQQGTRAFNLDLPDDQKLRLRIGVNIGDLIYQGSDVFGDGVNIAARLQSIAEVDGVLVSQTVRDYVREEASFAFDDMGQRSLKNIERPVRVYRVRQPGEAAPPVKSASFSVRSIAFMGAALALIVLVGGGAYWYLTHERRAAPRRPAVATAPAAPAVQGTPTATPSPAPPQPAPPTAAAPAPASAPQAASSASIPPAIPPTTEPRFSLVLVPLRPVNGDAKDRYLSDGVTRRLIGALGRLPDGLVIARETSMGVRGRGTDAKALAAELNVRYVAEGTLGRDDAGVHLTVRLIDSQTGENVWRERVDRPRAELAAAEAELLSSLAGALGVKPEAIQRAAAALPPAMSAELDDLVLQGWEAAYRPATAENPGDAQALFEKVLASDAGNLEAMLGLAFLQLRGIAGKPLAERRARLQRADELVTRVLEHRPNDERALMLKAEVLMFNSEPERALASLDRALALDPSLAEAWALYGGIENRRGREAESIPHLRRAIRLSPRDPALGLWLTLLGADEFATGSEADAAADLRKAVDANARLALPHLWLAAIAARAGDTAQAKAALDDYLAREPGATIAKLKQNPSLVRITDAVLDGLRKAGMAEE
jgi:class 3 adenylate cyclase/TolB-like protein/Tfp pilus assembly protein PilF